MQVSSTDRAKTTALVKEALAGFTTGAMMITPAMDLDTEASAPMIPIKGLQYNTANLPPIRSFGLGKFENESRAQQAPSSTYLAAKRRSLCRRASQSIVSLEKWQAEPEFVVWTQEPLSIIRSAIKFLDDAEQFSEIEHEGNSCEVLRQIRDSFLNRGWNRYRDFTIRQAITRILDRLASEEVITAEFASDTMDQLFDLSLQPVVLEALRDADEEEDDC